MPTFDVHVGITPEGGVVLQVGDTWYLVPAKAPLKCVRRHLDGDACLSPTSGPASSRAVQLRLNKCFAAATGGRVVRTWKELTSQLRSKAPDPTAKAPDPTAKAPDPTANSPKDMEPAAASAATKDTIADRDQAIAARDQAIADRDRAIKDRDRVLADLLNAVRVSHAVPSDSGVEAKAKAYCDEIALAHACIAKLRHSGFGDCPPYGREIDRVHAWGELSPECTAVAQRWIRRTAIPLYSRLANAAAVLKLVRPSERVTEANAKAVALKVMRAVHPDKGARGAAGVGAAEVRTMQTVAGDVLHLLGMLKK